VNGYLFIVLEFGPKTTARIFDRIPAAQWDVARDPDRFTPREVIAHLADWEPIMLERMEVAQQTPGAAVEVWDEGRMAEEHGYRHLDPQEQLQIWAQRRACTAAWLRRLSPDALSKTFLHPERGVQTIEDQANLLISHDLYHIEQLSAYLT
jgi:hypothetical protein